MIMAYDEHKLKANGFVGNNLLAGGYFPKWVEVAQ